MAEEPAAAEETQTTPQSEPSGAPDGPPAEPTEGSTPASDYEQRYNDLRPQYDRTHQRLSEYERFIEALSDPEQQAAALRAFGIELEDDEQYDFDEEPDWEDRFERIESVLQDQATQAQEAEAAQYEEQWLDLELDRLDPKEEWPESYVDKVVRLSYSFADEEGIPDLEAAHASLQQEFEAQRKNWVASKRAPQAPSGASASHQPDLDDRDQRREYMARRMADLSEAGG